MHVKKTVFFEKSIAILTHFQKLQSRAGTDPNKSSQWRGAREVYNITHHSDSHSSTKSSNRNCFSSFHHIFLSWTGKRQDAHGRLAQKCFPLIKTPPPRKRNDVFKRRTLNMTVYVKWKGHFSDLSYLHVIFSHYI